MEAQEAAPKCSSVCRRARFDCDWCLIRLRIRYDGPPLYRESVGMRKLHLSSEIAAMWLAHAGKSGG